MSESWMQGGSHMGVLRSMLTCRVAMEFIRDVLILAFLIFGDFKSD